MIQRSRVISADPTSSAVELAASAHKGQLDKQDEPAILHPLRVMAGVTRAWKFMHPSLRKQLEANGVTVNHLRAVAVLHDTLEDTLLTVGDLRDFHWKCVAEPVHVLTRSKTETYTDFIERVKLNPVAIHIKLLDITDNMNRGRGQMSKSAHENLLRRYAKAKAKLEARIYESIEASCNAI